MADDVQPPNEPPADAGSSASRSSMALARLNELRTRVLPSVPEYAPDRRRQVWLMAMYVVRRWMIEDRGTGLAALLTIQTLLSTVPIIGVALLLVGLMDENAGAKLLHDMFRSLVPETDRAAEMAEGAMALARNVTVGHLGGVGFLATLVIAFVLFLTLERTFNRIWRVARRRSLLLQFTMFYTLATLGPVLMLLSLATPLVAGVSLVVGTPIVTTIVSLILLNRFLPYTQVRWRAALIGGGISAVLLELAKYVFGFYAARFALQTYEGLYGSLAILPILIVWSYASWLVILLGAEITYAVHSRRAIALQGYVNRYVLERGDYQRPSGRTAARIVLAVCDHYARRRVGISIEALGERFRLGLDHVGEIVDALERRGFLLETAEPIQIVIPAIPPEQIKVIDVLTLFDRDHTAHHRADELGARLDRLDGARAEIMAELTYADLVDLTGARKGEP